MTSEIQKDITTLARKCLKACIPNNTVAGMIMQAMQNEWQRTLIEAPGLVRAEKKE